MTGSTPDRERDDRIRVIVDSHVHIHDCYDLTEFLDCAHANFSLAAGELGVKTKFAGVLMLTENSDADYFARLSSGDTTIRGWQVVKTDEPCSLIVERGNERLVIIAGSQVAGAEDLEVLMLGTTERVADGRPMRELLEQAERLGLASVVPWGAGKWYFSRGKLVGEIIRTMQDREFFLGDEGGRPVFWPTPTLFRDAGRHGVRILRGTDPLPFPWEVHRVASFGFNVKAVFDWSRPWAGIRPLLSDPGVTLEPYGRLERPIRFFRNQYGMQVRKRRRSR